MASLSRNVLSMKFMQRTKEKIQLKQEVETLFGKAVDEPKEPPEIEVWKTEDSYAPCEGLLFGRMSFRGYNAEIERLMAEKRGIKYADPAEQSQEPVDVTAAEMAQMRTEEPVTEDRSGQVKRKRSKYIRPVDDS